jgi:hypothetical protein
MLSVITGLFEFDIGGVGGFIEMTVKGKEVEEVRSEVERGSWSQRRRYPVVGIVCGKLGYN